VTRVGRPRARGPSTSGLSPRHEIIEVAAALFTTVGYAATTTRQIAERAGLRQASLYYYFPDKEGILDALLTDSMRPLVSMARQLARRGEDPEVRLWALSYCHIRYLVSHPYDLGGLYVQPELRSERFADFHAQRGILETTYRSLVAATAAGHGLPPDELRIQTELVLGFVEVASRLRREDPALDAGTFSAHGADAALRLGGFPASELPAVRAAAAGLLAILAEGLPPGGDRSASGAARRSRDRDG